MENAVDIKKINTRNPLNWEWTHPNDRMNESTGQKRVEICSPLNLDSLIIIDIALI